MKKYTINIYYNKSLVYTTTNFSGEYEFYVEQLGYVINSKNRNKKTKTIDLYVMTKDEKLLFDRDKKLTQILDDNNSQR